MLRRYLSSIFATLLASLVNSYSGLAQLPAGVFESGTKARATIVSDGSIQMELLAPQQGAWTGRDVVTWDKTRKGPLPAVPLGGVAEIDTGHEAFTALDVTPGRYVAMCFSDAPDGKSHVAHGMVHEVDIAAGT